MNILRRHSERPIELQPPLIAPPIEPSTLPTQSHTPGEPISSPSKSIETLQTLTPITSPITSTLTSANQTKVADCDIRPWISPVFTRRIIWPRTATGCAILRNFISQWCNRLMCNLQRRAMLEKLLRMRMDKSHIEEVTSLHLNQVLNYEVKVWKE